MFVLKFIRLSARLIKLEPWFQLINVQKPKGGSAFCYWASGLSGNTPLSLIVHKS